MTIKTVPEMYKEAIGRHNVQAMQSHGTLIDANQAPWVSIGNGSSTRCPMSLLQRLQARLEDGYYEHTCTWFGFKDLRISRAEKQGDKVYLFVLNKDGAIIIEDDANMYPSDVLITKLRLMAQD
jgi:Cys-tRNA synthase (O-phospho-L-seryl-tRNA:Cys-tRNA synthase)